MNNAELGLTAQKIICDQYGLTPHQDAYEQFNSGYNPSFKSKLLPVIESIFKELNLTPIECTTYAPSSNPKEKFIPYNFILNNHKTLSIRTSKTSDKIAPRVVGQAGYNTLNAHFGDLAQDEIKNQEDIKQLVYHHIHEMLPTFIDYLLNSDYTVWLYPEEDSFNYVMISGDSYVNMEFNRINFTFTKTLDTWKESITLKYKGISIAEIQVHLNRTFKFRFLIRNLLKMLKEVSITTETLGITAEKTICDLFQLKYPDNFKSRSSNLLEHELLPTVTEAFKYLPQPISHTGALSGTRKGNSKCSYDFVLTGNLTLSLKTNIGDYVCPPEVGQPSDKTFYLYFKDLITEGYVNEAIFKRLVLEKVDQMIPIYLNHLFDSDYLLWLFKKDDQFDFKIIEKNASEHFIWDKNLFTFTKPTINEWNESNSLKYDGTSLGNFQFHRNRNCYKFRFNFPNLLKIINGN